MHPSKQLNVWLKGRVAGAEGAALLCITCRPPYRIDKSRSLVRECGKSKCSLNQRGSPGTQLLLWQVLQIYARDLLLFVTCFCMSPERDGFPQNLEYGVCL